MKKNIECSPGGSWTREHIEGLIAAYPNLSPRQMSDVLHWFKHDASALDVGMVASNPDIAERYRQFRADHIDRVSRRDIILVAFVAILILVVIGTALIVTT